MKQFLCATSCALLLLVSCGESSGTPTDTTPAEDSSAVQDTTQETDSALPHDSADTAQTPDTATPQDDTEINDTETSDHDVQADPQFALKEKVAGVWAQKLFLTANATAPVVSKVTTETTKLLRVLIENKNGVLTSSYTVCDLQTNTGTDLVKTIFTKAFKEKFTIVKSTQFKNPKEEITLTGTAADNYTITLNKWYELRGIQMTDPENDLMPDKKNNGNADPRIFDQDEDSKPGMTLKFQGVVTGDLYGAMRSYMILASKSTTAERIEGSVEWAEEDYVIDATAELLKSERTITPILDKSNFVMVKQPDTITCDEIIKNKDTIFGN